MEVADISDEENVADCTTFAYVRRYMGPSYEDLPMEVISRNNITPRSFIT